MDSAPPSYKGHRYPVEIIAHCVWLYHRFPLSFREVEELMLERGVLVSHETVRRRCTKFGQTYANGLRQRPAPPVCAAWRQVAPGRGLPQDQR
ncbi:transposase-like protein [Streptomyces sp. TE3672]